MTSWRILIKDEMDKHNETFDDVVSCTLTDEGLDKEFYEGFGLENGRSFTLWTKKRVYFPASYDGSEWVASVSREPNGIPTSHIGG